MKWHPFPMIRVAGFFVGGVLLGIFRPDFVSFKILIGVILLCTFSFFIVKSLFSKSGNQAFSIGFLGLLAVFFMGYARLVFFTDSNKENHFSKISEPIAAYEATISGAIEEKAKSWKVEVNVNQVKTTKWQPVIGKLLLYVSKKNNAHLDWQYGDRILVKGTPRELSAPVNPYEFDFKRFLSFKNISHQCFTSIENVKLVARSADHGLNYYSYQARAWCMKKLNEFVHGEDERAIAIALVLGVTDGIDNDLQNAYAASGAMHVLAVSGMHVGIIYAIILILFKPIEKFGNSKWLVAVISLTCLWSFSFVTGNSPSVLRAVTMFSFLALARPFGMRTNIYNTLAASAFVLLLYNPYLIMSVGFQLSYLAVLGIVYLQRPLYQLWEIKNTIGDWVWKITCVSLAAQVATFALGLLYFHQFPTYFLISNLFVIPLSTLVLLGGIFLLTVNFISPLASVVGLVLEYLIKALNWIVFKTEALPLSLINDIHLTIVQCWLLMAIIVSLILLLEMKSAKWLYVAFALTIALAMTQWNHFRSEVSGKQLAVYSIKSHQAIEFIDNGKSFLISDSILLNDHERIRLHILPNRLVHGVYSSETPPFSRITNGLKIFSWNNITIAQIEKEQQYVPTSYFDYLIVSKNALAKGRVQQLNVKQIIFDGTNSDNYVEMMKVVAEERQIQVYSVLKQGAFLIQ